MEVPECTTELGRLYFLDYEEPQNCVQGKQYDQTELWGYSSAGMQKIRSRVLLVGKPNNGKGLTRIVVMKKGKKLQSSRQ